MLYAFVLFRLADLPADFERLWVAGIRGTVDMQERTIWVSCLPDKCKETAAEVLKHASLGTYVLSNGDGCERWLDKSK